MTACAARPLSKIEIKEKEKRPPVRGLFRNLNALETGKRLEQCTGLSMLYSRERSLVVFLSFPVLIFLSGCGVKPECDSFETRNAVLQIVSDDHNNALATYAAKNSNVVKEKSSNPTSEAEKSASLERTKPLYLLDEKIVTTSTSADKRTLKCSGSLSVTVGDTKASKEVNFTVQQSSDGKITVSVAPFQF
jgi:hypothetical protein